jgi:hypothetical protein
MYTIHINNHNLRQAELIQEAKKYRLILAIREKNTSTKGIAKKIQSLISTIFLP